MKTCRRQVISAKIVKNSRISPPTADKTEQGLGFEKGAGRGIGYNINFPLPEKLERRRYTEVLEKALRAIRRFGPEFLVVALGLDTAKHDPTGTWSLEADDFESNGRLIGAMKLPTVVVQEGGYNSRNLGINTRWFFLGLWRGMYA